MLGSSPYRVYKPWSRRRRLLERFYLLFTLLWFGLIFLYPCIGKWTLVLLLFAGNLGYLFFAWRFGDRMWIIDFTKKLVSRVRNPIKHKQPRK